MRTKTTISTASLLFVLMTMIVLAAPNVAAKEAADLDQCRNGGFGETPINPCDWVNGNINDHQGHFYEGQSVPYRMVLTGLTPGVQSTLVVGFDVKQSGKFALDYITSNDRISEAVNPCVGVVGACNIGTPFAIPLPNTTGTLGNITPATVIGSFNGLNASEREMDIYNGVINSISLNQAADLAQASSEEQFTIKFTPSASTAVLSWGGHISRGADYPGLSAVTLPGSPYHMRLKSLNGAGGNQDRALAAAAVLPLELPLNVSKTASTSLTRTFQWTIDKSVSPASQSLFAGQSGASTWNVSVVKTGSVDSNWAAAGTITIRNPAGTAANITSVSDMISGDIAATVSCPFSFPHTLAAGANATCTYSASLPDGTSRVNTVTVTTSGPIAGSNGSANVNFAGATVNAVNAQINVNDSNGMNWIFNNSNSVAYNESFNCNGVQYTDGVNARNEPNTATITQTGQSDSASVAVTCYQPSASKTADESIDQKIDWSIVKSVDQEQVDLFDGTDETVTYTVEVVKGAPYAIAWYVNGQITIVNPAPMVLPLSGVTDAIANSVGAVSVDCGGASSVAANSNLVCSYSAQVSNGASGTNTASVNFSGSITDLSPTAPIDFSGASVNSVTQDAVDVTDTNGQSWGTNHSESWNYNVTFDCVNVEYTDGANSRNEPNTATITQTNQSDQASVAVSCYRPSVSKNASTSLTRTHTWSIEKSASPTSHSLFAGQSADSEWTIAVTKTGVIDDAWTAAGSITIVNPNPNAALPLASVTDLMTGDIGATVDCGLAESVPADGSLVCSYSAELPNGADRTNTVTVVFSNGASSISGSAPVSFAGATVTDVNPTITVTDTNGEGPWEFSDSGSELYTDTFDCAAAVYDEAGVGSYQVDNTATISQTGQFDDASVAVSCYQPSASKTAVESIDEAYSWEIFKSVSDDNLDIFAGDDETVTYTVEVVKTGPSPTAWYVDGQITIVNPAPMALPLDGVTDTIANSIGDVTVDCGDAEEVAANSNLVCDYSAQVSNGDSGTNTASVNFGGSITDLGPSAPIDFADPIVKSSSLDGIDVTDTNGQSWGTNHSATFTYDVTFDCSNVEYTDGVSTREEPNTAAITQTDQSDSESVSVSCYRPSASKTADESIDQTYNWSIFKSASPDELSLFDGDSAVVNYTVNVVKSAPVPTGWSVSGTITITNPAPVDLPLDGVTDSIEGFGAVAVDCDGATVVPANNVLECTYSATLPNGDTRLNTASIDFSGNITDAEATASVDFAGATVNDETLDEISVADPEAPVLMVFSETDETSYTKVFDCSGLDFNGANSASGSFDNTATILETGANATATVDLSCYKLAVSKSADTSFDRGYTWTIDKTAETDNLTLAPGQIYNMNYEVTVTPSAPQDSNFAVTGEIEISNPNPSSGADITGVIDAMSGDIAGAVDCPSNTVPADSSIVCTYSSALPDATERLNTATVTQQNYAYDQDGLATADGTSEYGADANVIFGEPTNVYNDSITVTDSLAGELGVVNVVAGKQTFNYAYAIGPYLAELCGPQPDVVNTASFTSEYGAAGEANWTVHVDVPCPLGCTLTQGYWKTHSLLGKAPYDDNWANLTDLDLDTVSEQHDETFYKSGQTWYQVFWTPVKGNTYYQLAHQYEAAYLNVLNGAATTSSVQQALADAETLFNTYTPAQIAAMKGKAATQVSKQFNTLAGILGSYNEGAIGPGHCDEDQASVA